MKTRDKIIEQAIELFNDKGAANVTSRHIAEAMDISHGNLCYQPFLDIIS